MPKDPTKVPEGLVVTVVGSTTPTIPQLGQRQCSSRRQVSSTATQEKIHVLHPPLNYFLLGLLSLYFVTSTHFLRINPEKQEQWGAQRVFCGRRWPASA